MKKYLNAFFPLVTMLTLLVLPVCLTAFFLITQYADHLVLQYDISYLDVQNNWFGEVIVNQSWLGWFNRLMDFVFWGMLASVMLVGIWAFSLAKVAFQNHYAQEHFVHFREEKATWHSRFFTVVALKSVLVFLILYSVFAIVGRLIPQLSASITPVLSEVTMNTVWPIVTTFVAIYAYEYIIVLSARILHHLRVE